MVKHEISRETAKKDVVWPLYFSKWKTKKETNLQFNSISSCSRSKLIIWFTYRIDFPKMSFFLDTITQFTILIKLSRPRKKNSLLHVLKPTEFKTGLNLSYCFVTLCKEKKQLSTRFHLDMFVCASLIPR